MKRIALALCGILLLAGCASAPEPAFTVEAADQNVPAPAADKAQIVFIQPFKPLGGNQVTGLFEAQGASGRTLLAATSSKSKAIVDVAPGQHLFMSNGFGTSFMRASVEAGKRYYVLVRFVAYVGYQMRPIRRNGPSDYNAGIAEFQDWLHSCPVVTGTPELATSAWFMTHPELIDKAQASAWESWARKAPEEQAELTLNPGDDIAQ